MQTKLYIAALTLVVLAGCAPKPDAPAKADQPIEPAAVAKAPQGGSSGIQPMTSNVGGITPVAGAESVDGASGYGGGIGDAAKRSARKAAASESAGTQSQAPTGDGGN